MAAPALLVATGCGSGSPGSSQGATLAPDGALVVHMQNIAFVPKQVTVHVGQRIRWVNDDTVQHDVKADSGARFQSRDFGRGGSFTYTPRATGTIAYECDLHPGMVGTLTVIR